MWGVNRAMSYLLLCLTGIINCNFTHGTFGSPAKTVQVCTVRLQYDTVPVLEVCVCVGGGDTDEIHYHNVFQHHTQYFTVS